MHRLLPLEKDYYLDNDDGGLGRRSDDEDDSGSSDDEVQRMFADIAGVQLPSQRKRQIKHERSFEDEMEQELDASFKVHNAMWSGGSSAVCASTGQSEEPADIVQENRKRQSSIKADTSFQEQPKKVKTPQKKETKEDDVDPALGLNDDATESDEEFQQHEGMKEGDDVDDDKLLYDPDEDAANQNWVDNHRRTYQPHSSQHRPLPKSDAVLNCPACMTVLCLDCQRHEVYKTQYRAMFVTNCEVKRDELLYQSKSQKRGGAKKRMADAAGRTLKSGERLSANDDAETIENIKKNSRPEDLFYPVICCVCKTEVGVYDSDEVYHFFNILASYA